MDTDSLLRTRDCVLFLIKYRNISNDEEVNAEEFVQDLQELGPTFIKIGQLLSTQAPYLFPRKVEKCLLDILDNVKPTPYEDIIQVVKSEFDVPIENIFSYFSKEPIASASLGQVHRAKLVNGLDVCVKVQKPDVYERVRKDLSLLKSLSEKAEAYFTAAEELQLMEVVDQLSESMLDELDYRKEAKNMKKFQENLKEFTDIIVPEPLFSVTTEKVLTMELLEAKSLMNNPVPKDIDGKNLGTELFKCFLKQILVDGVYHMDPHGGNVYFCEKKLALLDYGMVGKVPRDLQGHLTKLLIFLSKAEEEEGVEVLMRLGKRQDDFDYYKFKNRVGRIFASFQDKSMKSLSVGEELLNLYNTAMECNLLLPPVLSVISKAIANLDQVCKKLAPSLDLNSAIEEYINEVLEENVKRVGDKRSFFQSAMEAAKLAKEIPFKLEFLIDELIKGDFQLKLHVTEQRQFADSIQDIANRITIGLILASMVIGSALIMQIPSNYTIFGYPALSMILFLGAFLGAFIILIRILYDKKE